MDDFDFLCDLHADEDVMQFVGGVQDRAQTEKLFHERILPYYDLHPGLGCWLAIDRASGKRVGISLLNEIRGEKHIQVGYILPRVHWGCGYATEICVALVRDDGA